MLALHCSDTQRNVETGPVQLYQFTSWPDFGVPNSCKSVVDLTKYIRSKIDLNGGK